ncbi:MAG TPA: SRPBCC domain-containing protein [Verrucomicrobiae bacterium]|nr:SRPBCC domain-containing protein [Verrucomicrobiae bacterium]
MKAEAKPELTLQITRTFAAPRELVFKAWTNADMIKHWWGCKEFPACHMEMDARTGGAWRGCLRSEAGGEIWLEGKFIEVTPPERLVFTFIRKSAPEIGIEPVDTRVTATFTEAGGKTLLQMRQEIFPSVELRDDHGSGWNISFGRLDGIFAAHTA